jgi:hypothetical protein
MKRSFGLIVVIVGVVIIGWFAYDAYKEKAVELDRAADLARIQNNYYERIGWIRANPDDKAYRDEVVTFFRWYFKEINEHQNRYGGNKAFDDYLKEIETRAERLSEAQIKDRKRVYEQVRQTFDQFKTGSYAPIYSATDDGLRFDVVSADVKMIGGQPQIHMPIVLWGAMRELREDDKKMKKMVTSATFNVQWRLFDAKGKLVGEMTASGDPTNKIDHPERFVPHFPAQVVLGQYDIDLLPNEVSRVEMEFTVTSRAPTGGEARGNFTWKLDAPAAWKLKEGEAWRGAEESVRPIDEIDPASATKVRR